MAKEVQNTDPSSTVDNWHIRVNIRKSTDGLRWPNRCQKAMRRPPNTGIQTDETYKATYGWRENRPVNMLIATNLDRPWSGGEVLAVAWKIQRIDIYARVDEDRVNDHLLATGTKVAVNVFTPGKNEMVTLHPPQMYKRADATASVSFIDSPENNNLVKRNISREREELIKRRIQNNRMNWT